MLKSPISMKFFNQLMHMNTVFPQGHSTHPPLKVANVNKIRGVPNEVTQQLYLWHSVSVYMDKRWRKEGGDSLRKGEWGEG